MGAIRDIRENADACEVFPLLQHGCQYFRCIAHAVPIQAEFGARTLPRSEERQGVMMSFRRGLTCTAARLDASHPPPSAFTRSTLATSR